MILSVSFLLSSCCLQAEGGTENPPLAINGFGRALRITRPISGLVDSSRSLELSNIRDLVFGASYEQVARQIADAPRSADFWLKCGLENTDDSPLDLSLDAGNLNYIDLFFVSADGVVQEVRGGNLRPDNPGSSYVQKQMGVLPLRLGAHQAGELFVKIRQRTDEYDFSGIRIYDPQAVNDAFIADARNSHQSSIFPLLFQGFLICQLLYVIFQWMIIRRKEYLYYFFYLGVISLYFLSKQESFYGVPLLFSHYPLLRIYLGKTMLILPYFLYFRFIRSFLDMPVNYPRVNKWIRGLEYFLLVYLLFDLGLILITFNRGLQTLLYTIILGFVFLITTGLIIYMFRRGQPLLYYVISGSLFVATGHILGLVFSYLEIVRHLDLGIPNVLIFSQVGIVLEIVCFTAGLSYKSHAAEKEKIRSQENLIEQLKANEILQSNMQHIRNKIARDLHDDIGSTLSSISILSGLALREKDTDQTLGAMSEIKASSISLMEKMDDIVWSINPRNDTLENLLMRVRHFATTLFEARGIEYKIIIEDPLDQVRLPMDFRQHIYLILKEAINNLIKYSEATEAGIRVGCHQQVLTLSVWDNGQGFDTDLSFSGNGLLSMKNRAALMQAELVIRSGRGQGTEIILRVTVESE